LTRFQYDTPACLQANRRPLRVAHSRDDEIVPFRLGQRLFATARTESDGAEARKVTAAARVPQGIDTESGEF